MLYIYSGYSPFSDDADFISRGGAVARYENRNRQMYLLISCNMKRLLSNAAFKIRSKVYFKQYNTFSSFIHRFGIDSRCSTQAKNDTVSIRPNL